MLELYNKRSDNKLKFQLLISPASNIKPNEKELHYVYDKLKNFSPGITSEPLSNPNVHLNYF